MTPMFGHEVSSLLVALAGGLLLAAATGLRAFLPACVLGWAAHFQLVHLNVAFSWLAAPEALVALTAAVVVELAADKIPVLDHLLDVLGVVAKPTAAFVAVAASQASLAPQTAFVVGLVLGAPLAAGAHVAKAKGRLLANAATLGLAAPFVSVLEDLAALLLVASAILLPAAALLLVLMLMAIVRLRRRGAPAG
jgi:hypothetical protein